MGQIRLKTEALADIVVPAAGKTTIFVDEADGILKVMDDAGDVAAIDTDSFAEDKRVDVHTAFGVAAATGVTGAAVYVLSNLALGLMATNGSARGFYFNPASYTKTGKALKLRCSYGALVAATAPGQNATMGIYPISTVGGGANTSIITALGAVVPGTTAVLASGAELAANAKLPPQLTAEITVPGVIMPAGWYTIGVDIPAAWTANAAATLHARVQVRNV